MHPQTTPRIRAPAPFMHLYRLVFSKSRCLWPSLSDLFFGPFGLLVLLGGLYSPLKPKKIAGAGALHPPLRRCATGAPLCGARAGLRPTRNPTAISNPNPNPTAISTKTADFVYLCRCPPLISGLLLEAPCLRGLARWTCWRLAYELMPRLFSGCHI
jgi:hypothetical protein